MSRKSKVKKIKNVKAKGQKGQKSTKPHIQKFICTKDQMSKSPSVQKAKSHEIKSLKNKGQKVQVSKRPNVNETTCLETTRPETTSLSAHSTSRKKYVSVTLLNRQSKYLPKKSAALGQLVIDKSCCDEEETPLVDQSLFRLSSSYRMYSSNTNLSRQIHVCQNNSSQIPKEARQSSIAHYDSMSS